MIKLVAGISLLMMTCSLPAAVQAQNEVPANKDTIEQVTFKMQRGLILDSTYKNVASGEFTPGRGFDIAKSKFGSLNISLYALVRYLNQMPGSQTWFDHLGRPKEFVGRNDFYWHRAMIWFSGFIGTPKLRYTATVWTIMPTQQTLVYGNIQYTFNKHIQVAMGIGPNLSIRSMQGPFPFYSSTDRTMGEDALRGGFTQGLFVRGEIVPKLTYWLMLGNNLSTLGVQASKLTRDLSKSINLTWMPTTGEFGPRGGDEINLVKPGKDYGWPTITYGIEYSGEKVGDALQQKAGMEQPVYYWDPVVSPSGMSFYHGNTIPEWHNNLFIACLSGTHIARIVIKNNKVVGEERLLADKKERFRDVAYSNGMLYALTDGGDIYKISKK